MEHGDAKALNHASEQKPFHETVMFKALAVAAVITGGAGVAATGGAVATYYHHPAAVGVAYGVADSDRADPYHADPGGEFTRVEPPQSGGTATIFHVILAPGD